MVLPENQGSWNVGVFNFFFNWEGVYMTCHALKAQKCLELDLQQVRCGFFVCLFQRDEFCNFVFIKFIYCEDNKRDFVLYIIYIIILYPCYKNTELILS